MRMKSSRSSIIAVHPYHQKEPSMHPRAEWIAAAALLALGCTGNVGEPGTAPPPGTTVTPPAAPGQQPVAPPTVNAAVAPMRRLTREQYRNTVRDLLGVADAVAPSALPGDDTINDRFASNTASPLQAIDVGKYADAAEAVAGKAVATLAALVPCPPASGDAGCARRFIEQFGKRAYRRPLTMAEADLLQTLYAAGEDFPTGIRLVIAGVLQSPKFLSLPEPVPANAAGKVVGVDA